MIAVVGALMIAYVLIGGMKGTTWVQIIKAVLLIVGAARDDDLGARASTASTSPTLLGDAVDRAARRARSCSSRARSTASPGSTKLDFISLALALVLGTAGLPHILMRFYTVPTAKEARTLGACGRSG